jgi:hypothetical protein
MGLRLFELVTTSLVTLVKPLMDGPMSSPNSTSRKLDIELPAKRAALARTRVRIAIQAHAEFPSEARVYDIAEEIRFLIIGAWN